MSQRQPNFSLQALEPRRLLHAGPLGALVDCPEVTEARTALTDALHQLRTDRRDGQETLLDDRKAVRDEYQKLIDDQGGDTVQAALQPLKEKLRADEKAKFKELRAAGEELRLAKRDARKTLFADLQALHEAQQSGDQDAIDAARQKLEDDKAQVQEDLKPIRDNIIAIKDKWRPIITADHDAIENKLVDLDPALGPLFDKVEEDANALHEKLVADQEIVTGKIEDLKTAIEECRAETTTT
jgi:hypothetical protein